MEAIMERQTAERNKSRVESTFRVIDLMEDIRDVWRASAPLQNLSEDEKEKVVKKIEKARKALDKIEATL